jgi:hypothetical protein
MKTIITTTTLLCSIFLSGCQKPADSTADSTQQATVYLRDGGTASGTVVTSTPKEITIRDANSTRTFEMTRVKSVEFGDPMPPAGAAPGGTPTSSSYPQNSSSSRPALVERDVIHEQHRHPVESVINTKTYDLRVGTQIAIRTEETIDSSKAAEGQIFAAEVAANVVDAAGDIVIPKGANAQVVIKSAAGGGRFHGAADLLLDLKTVSIDGRIYQIDAADIHEKGRSNVGLNKRTAEFSGGGAAIGAIIGAIAGRGKGAAIGAGSGAGAGALAEILTKGGSIKIPVESVLTFQLDREFRVNAHR